MYVCPGYTHPLFPLADSQFFTPAFVEFASSDVEANKCLMEKSGVQYPFGECAMTGDWVKSVIVATGYMLQLGYKLAGADTILSLISIKSSWSTATAGASIWGSYVQQWKEETCC